MRRRGGGGGVLRRVLCTVYSAANEWEGGEDKGVMHSARENWEKEMYKSSVRTGRAYPYVRYISIASIARMKGADLFSGGGG